jgi:protoporphyrinogen oxidase
LEKVDYLSLLCVTLVLTKSLCPFYVTNLTDSGFPFTGLIEATHVIPAGALKGKALVYLPRYMPPEDPFYNKSDEEVIDIFLGALRRIFPDIADKDILAKRIHRERFVQPIQKMDYSKNIPPMQTPLKNLYMANTTMILNSTLNNNEVIKLAKKAAEVVGQD